MNLLRQKTKTMKAKLAALLFFLFFLYIVCAADAGHLPAFFRSLYDFPNGDRVGHVIIYGILGFLISRAFPAGVRLGRVSLPIAIIALLVFSALEEWSQSLFSTRTADPIDLACSWTGIFLGNWVAIFRRERQKAK